MTQRKGCLWIYLRYSHTNIISINYFFPHLVVLLGDVAVDP